MALLLKGVDFDIEDIQIFEGQQHEPRYMKINPGGTVPSMQDGDKVLTDSDDIIEYIDKKFPKGNFWVLLI